MAKESQSIMAVAIGRGRTASSSLAMSPDCLLLTAHSPLLADYRHSSATRARDRRIAGLARFTDSRRVGTGIRIDYLIPWPLFTTRVRRLLLRSISERQRLSLTTKRSL